VSDWIKQIEALSPEKRELLELLLKEEGTTLSARSTVFAAPRTSVEATLAELWQQVLGVEPIGINDNFFELGGDSIQCIQIVAKARQAGLLLTTNQLFEHPTIAELAGIVGWVEAPPPEPTIIDGPVPLTPIQRWFFEQKLPAPDHWNQAVMLEGPGDCDTAALETAFQELARQHDALRLRFRHTATGTEQFHAASPEAFPFLQIDLSNLPPAEQGAAVEQIAAEMQTMLNLATGPLISAALFRLGPPQAFRLLLLAHHLVVDGISFRILLEDLQTAYRQLTQGEALQLAPKTTSFQEWANRLAGYAQSTELQQEAPYWLAEVGAEPLPVDFPAGGNLEASARAVITSLGEAETRALLQNVPAAYRTQINDVLLTALVLAVTKWTGQRALLLDMEGHGREEVIPVVDLSRTVGWFTSLFPVALELGEARLPVEALKTIKEQLRRIPQRGIGYGVLRYLCPEASTRERLTVRRRAEIIFNYLGQFDQTLASDAPFRLARESHGPLYGGTNPRPYLLQVVGSVLGGQLQMTWYYSAQLHATATVEGLAQDFIATLRSLIQESQSAGPSGLSPSDFPEAELSQAELDRLFTKNA
jgi:non-ribosomal peptide synthase protein (TIGR01720 family)